MKTQKAESQQANGKKTDTAGKPDESLVKLQAKDKTGGKDRYLNTLKLAVDTITYFAESEKQILTIRGSLGAKFMELAKECVTQATTGKKADLALAAVLLRDACKFAEQEIIARDAKEQPNEATRAIGEIVPSWSTFRTDAVKALENKLAPEKFDNFTQYRKAYNDLTKAGGTKKDARGAHRKAKTSASKSEAAKKAAGVADDKRPGLGRPQEVACLSDKAGEGITRLVTAFSKLPASLQDQPTAWLGELIEKVEAYAKSVRSRRAPAREAQAPGAQAA